MTAEEMRRAILVKIDQLPEKDLLDILDYSNKILARTKRSELVKSIIEEDHEVFKRLAE